MASLLNVQTSCHPEAGALCPPKDLGEPREASRFLRRNKSRRLARFLIPIALRRFFTGSPA